MAKLEPTDPVEIARFLDLRAAEIALSVLESSGIEGHLDQPYIASLAPHYSFGTGGVRLFVRAEDAERAIEALQPPNE
jgi:Putative prokaryotic signal transducing protein